MKGFLITAWARVRASYWFVPSVMAVLAVVLSFATTTLDARLGSDWMHDIGWMHANQPAGARAVLSTVAGSMITVAGVTFSMTILSISHTTGQVGPRLLSNFMSDRGNQFTLGVFISTFIYCLMVLRTVRNGENAAPGMAESALTAAFVPHIAVLVGVVMALASVGVLIYFIHHIPESIHVSNIVAGVGHSLSEGIERQFPTRIGEPPAGSQPEKCRGHETADDDNGRRFALGKRASSAPSTLPHVRSLGTGYLEYVDGDGLLGVATEHDLRLYLQVNPGDFVTRHSVLLLVDSIEPVGDELRKTLTSQFVFGTQRTPTQDLQFQINQLVEVAMRALSPGVNDPFTAIECMHWLQSALQQLATRELPEAYRYDEDDRLRVIALPVTFAAFTELVFDQLRPYVAPDRNAALRMMQMIGEVACWVESAEDRRLLARHACALRRECRRSISDRRVQRTVSLWYRMVLSVAFDPEYREETRNTGQWRVVKP